MTNEEYFEVLRDVHRCSEGQVRWFKAKLAEYGGSLERMWEMFPASAEEMFRVSGTPVFSSIVDTLIRLAKSPPQHSVWGDITVSGFGAMTRSSYPPPPVEIITQPQREKMYVIGADVGEGLTEDEIDEIEAGRGVKLAKTYSTASVRDVDTWELVCLVECQFPLGIFATLLENLGYMYNSALLGVEVNNAGHAIVKSLLDANYPALYCRTQRDKASEFRHTRDWGWQTTKQTKPIMESTWEEFIRNTPERMGSPRLASQGLTHVQKSNGSHGPQRGCFNDVLMADMICLQLLISQPVTQKMKAKITNKMKRHLANRAKKRGGRGKLNMRRSK